MIRKTAKLRLSKSSVSSSKELPAPAPNIDLRADRRFPVDVGGVLQVVGVSTDVYVITVLNVSRFGLRVSCSVPLHLWTQVEISCCETLVRGEVRHSTEVGYDEFQIGILAQSEIDLTRFLEPIRSYLCGTVRMAS